MQGDATGLSVDSATGIDVSLAVAGPGARSYAFVIDWHVRVVLALSWFAVSAVLYNGRFSLELPAGGGDARWFAVVLAPTLCIYFLYHPVVELLMRGSTPGKRMAGVRIVARDGGVPGAGALLIRNVFRLVDSLPMFYGVGLITVMLSRDSLRIGDMAAGTVLVFERADARLPGLAGEAGGGGPPDAGGTGRLDAAGVELVTELLERWPTLTPEARARLARALLSRYGGAPPEAGGEADEASWRTRLERLLRPQAQS
jgi:uncharacterized RDD family membrane protein YckC